jgi:hypothetical protein
MNNPYNFNGLLGGFAPRGFDPLRGQSLMGQPARMPAPSDATLSLQQRMQPQQGLLSRAGSGFAGAASGLGSGFAGAARGLGRSFTGEGSSARLSALGASLLQGPSRTPISLGSSVAQGLLAGNIAAQQEEERKFKRGLLEREIAVAEGKLRAEERKLSAGSLEELFIGTDKNGNIVGQFPQGSPEYFNAVSDPNITVYKTPKMPEKKSVQQGSAEKAYNKKTGEPVSLQKNQKNGRVYYTDLSTGETVDWREIAIGSPPSKASLGMGTGYAYTDNVGVRQVIYENDSNFTNIRESYGSSLKKIGTEAAEKKSAPKGHAMYEDRSDPTKIISTWFDPDKGRIDEATGEKIDEDKFRPVPSIVPNFKDINAAYNKVAEDASALRSLSSYTQSIEDSSFGFVGKVDDIKTGLKTLFGLEDSMTSNEMARKLGKAQQQGLLGLLRTQVVGGGVMTEQDAKRILEYMGGQVDSMFTNPNVIKEAIEYAIKERAKTGITLVKRYNKMSKRSEDFDEFDESIFTYKPNRLVPEAARQNGIKQSDWRSMTKDEKIVWLN